MNTRADAKRMLHELIAAFNAKDMDGSMALYADDFRYWSPGEGWTEGKTERRRHFEKLFSALPNERLVPEFVVAAGDLVVARFTSVIDKHGTSFEFPMTMQLSISDGRFTEGKTYVDPAEIEKALLFVEDG